MINTHIHTPDLPRIIPVGDTRRIVGEFTLEIFEARRLRSGRDIRAERPFDEQSFFNLSANAGLQLEADLLIVAGGTGFNNANAYIGAGNGTTAVNATHTDLQGASKTRKAMNATFPSRSSQTVTWKSDFATGDANYSWEEMAVFNAAAAGTMLARALVAAPFTKTSSLAITATYTRTVA
jgi:hypothetical protein